MKEQIDSQIKKVVKVIFPWEDDKEEKWLEEMAVQGWKFESATPFVYSFRKSTPEKVTLRMDYKVVQDKDYQEYLSLFHQAGWELVTQFSNWHYFRVNCQQDEVLEIFNSEHAKAEKYRRLLFGMFPLLPVFVMYLTLTMDNPLPVKGQVLPWVIFFGKILSGILLIVWGVVMIKVLRKIKKLETQSTE